MHLGTKGSFDIVIDTSGSEVGIDYEVQFENEVNKPANLQFIYEGNVVSQVKDLEPFLKGTMHANVQEKVKTMTVQWEWDYETGDTTEEKERQDERDTQDGKNLGTYQFDILVTGKQVEPTV